MCLVRDEEIEWMDIHSMEYYSDMRKKEILPFVTTWMDLESIMLSEIKYAKWNKPDREKQL